MADTSPLHTTPGLAARQEQPVLVIEGGRLSAAEGLLMLVRNALARLPHGASLEIRTELADVTEDLRMDYTDARWRRTMDLEGLTAWTPGQKDGYAAVMAAMQG